MKYRFSKTSMYLRLLAATWLACGSYSPVAVAEQKPIRQSEVHADGIESPETLDELWERATIVVEGQVVSRRSANETFTPQRSYPPGPIEPITMARTDYVIRVNRVLKSDAVVTQNKASIIVRRLGGTVDRGEYVEEIEDRDFAKFKDQGRYLLFLQPARGTVASDAVYFPVVGADSAFELLGDRVVPLGRAVASQHMAKLGAQQLVSMLARKGGR